MTIKGSSGFSREELSVILFECGVAKRSALDAVDRVEPILQVAAGVREMLFPAGEKTESQVLALLQYAFGKEQIKKVCMVSRQQPFSKPVWMTDRAYEQAVEMSFEYAVFNSVGRMFENMLWSSFGAHFNSVKETLPEAGLSKLEDFLEDLPKDTIWKDALGDILYLYLGFIIAGVEQSVYANRLQALIEIAASGFVPLGIKTGQQDTFLVQAA